MKDKDFEKFNEMVIAIMDLAYSLTNDQKEKMRTALKKLELEPQQPIIKKSGGTWVARYEGVDYLFIGESDNEPDFFSPATTISSLWQYISEIEITDEIAKLRPIVVYRNPDDKLIPHTDHLEILYGVTHDRFITDSYKEYRDFYRLATVSDLEDS